VKSYDGHPIVRGVSMKIEQGEFLTLLGPSGCGKTTCLRMVAGFIRPTNGRIVMAGRDITDLPPHRRNTAMVFQSYALFPHRTVAENIAFGLEVRKVPRQERRERIDEVLRLVKLGQLADRYPAQLSGGQRQRVALARAVVIKPDVLLLDEPLAALDLKLREELQIEIKRIQSTLKITTLFVTHDQGEALSMSDRIAVMNEGCIVQIADPVTVYENPNTRYVANFVGRSNLIEVVVRERQQAHYRVESRRAPGKSFRVASADRQLPIGDHCLLGTRPEHLRLGLGEENILNARVRTVTYRGSLRLVEAESEAGEDLSFIINPGDPVPAAGETVDISWKPTNCFLLPE
jgi:spermidine/putrescine ABC transporter ATP-binding subunit